MIRKEEIHEAAKEFAFSDKTAPPDFCNIINDFHYGAEWADKTMLDRACEWLSIYYPNIDRMGIDEFITAFRQAMEGGAE